MKKVFQTSFLIFLSGVPLNSIAQNKFSDQVLENKVRQQFKNINMQNWTEELLSIIKENINKL